MIVMAGFNDLVLLTLGERAPIRRPWDIPLWARSDAFKLLRAGLQAPAPGAPFQDPAGRWIEERRELRRSAVKVETLPDLDRGLDAFERRLSAITELCASRGARTVLANQSVLWRDSLPRHAEALLWTGWTADRSAFYTAGALRSAMEEFNARVEAVAVRQHREAIDVSGVSGDVESFYDDCHFTERGARRIAELVAEGGLAPP